MQLIHHTCEEVIGPVIREFRPLDHLVSDLSNADWARVVPRPENKDSWTIKDSLAHMAHWKAVVTRKIRGLRVPPEKRGLNVKDGNRLVYQRWHDRTPKEVLTWHRQVQEDVITALRGAPEAWFNGKENVPEWPFDIDGHSACHREKDIEQALTVHLK